MFRGLPAPDLGSGPIGPLFIGLIALFSRLKKNRFKKENK